MINSIITTLCATTRLKHQTLSHSLYNRREVSFIIGLLKVYRKGVYKCGLSCGMRARSSVRQKEKEKPKWIIKWGKNIEKRKMHPINKEHRRLIKFFSLRFFPLASYKHWDCFWDEKNFSIIFPPAINRLFSAKGWKEKFIKRNHFFVKWIFFYLARFFFFSSSKARAKQH